MRRSLLKRPSPGLVLACVALFVAMGGGAYAATSSDNKTDKKIAKKAAKSYFNGHIGSASVSHASTAGSANSANSATNATNATNASHASTADNATTANGQTLTNVNVNVPESGSQVVYNANSLSVTVTCSNAGEPKVEVNGPTGAELNWGGSADGTPFGGVDANVGGSPDDVTSGNGRGTGTFAESTNPPAHVVDGNLAWDDNPTHNGTFVGCSVWGTLTSS